ncbi:hypothetical protein ACFL27_19365 [candidate division CSSED10-310 bacterium]|uniref:Uncharacterized protein n=1 Tax=candidate division CSSED10-310 bacterium TaxID=2855610 RepID=A0ABV6Z1N2_UNCC1
MRIIAFIDQWKTIVKILKHLELWPPPARDPPNKKSKIPTNQPIQETLFSLEADFFAP